MVFSPHDPPVPTELRTPQFWIRPLRGSDNALDYEAVIESRTILRKFEQSDWPADGFSLADNLADLERHAGEHDRRESYTFTVMNPDGTECLGCIYLFPLSAGWLQNLTITSIDGTEWHSRDAVISFWIRESRLADGLDRDLLDAIKPWFDHEWDMRYFFLISSLFDQQVTMIEEAGLVRKIMTERAKDPVPNYAYG